MTKLINTSDQQTRRRVVEEIVDGREVSPHGGDIEWDHGGAADRYLLVEHGRHDGFLYLTSHPSPEAAGDYRDGQEYPEDWLLETLVDLDTGDRYAEVTSFKRVEPGGRAGGG